MSSGLKRTGRRSDATPFAGGRLPQFATVRQLDLDAARYLAAVEAADGARLEPAVRAAVNAFVVGCKADSIWTSIKASCILAGARTLSGALVPLVGTAPTNNNFASGDYARRTGLVGNGNNKYINTNRAENADSQNSVHLSVYQTEQFAASQYVMFGTDGTSSTGFYVGSNVAGTVGFNAYNRNSTAILVSTSAVQGFAGTSRSSSSTVETRMFGVSASTARTSNSSNSSNYFVFASSSVSTNRGGGRLAFYSIGESLDLAKLDARVTTLITAIGAAIP